MRNVLILGCFGGMGICTVKRFIDAGDNVYGIDIIDNNSLAGLKFYKTDIRNEVEIISTFNKIKEEIDHLDLIITLSGIYLMDSLLEVSDEDFKKILDINCLGVYRTVKTFFPLLKEKSKVIIISSELAPLDPLPFNGLYTISKSLLEKYAYSLRMELNLFKIDVVLLRPGAVKTGFLNVSQNSLDKMCNKTIIHKNTSKRFKKIVDMVETRNITTDKLSNKIFKISNKKHPKYVYSINRNPLLILLSILPDRLQVKIIGKLLK